jgi:hypothetical protein
MPDFDISINIYVLLLLLAIAAFLGFLVKSRLIGRKNRKIMELEREMMQAHAELLDTQKDYCELESRVKESDSPVISIKNNSNKQETPKRPSPDRSGDRKDRATGTE